MVRLSRRVVVIKFHGKEDAYWGGKGGQLGYRVECPGGFPTRLVNESERFTLDDVWERSTFAMDRQV
jgi:hypothetical protein